MESSVDVILLLNIADELSDSARQGPPPIPLALQAYGRCGASTGDRPQKMSPTEKKLLTVRSNKLLLTFLFLFRPFRESHQQTPQTRRHIVLVHFLVVLG